jgi:hypothetical protein
MAGWIMAATAVGVLGAGACSTDQPEVCDSLAAVQTSIDHVRETNVSENGLAHLRTVLDQLKTNLNWLQSEAAAQFDAQVRTVQAAVDELSTSAATARTTPNAANLAAVRSSLLALGESVQALGDAVASTC